MNIYVKPAKGLKVRDPINLQVVPEEGRFVPENSYWLRRERSGEVVRCEPPVVQQDQISDSIPPTPKSEE